jgi:hypothetical protein
MRSHPLLALFTATTAAAIATTGSFNESAFAARPMHRLGTMHSFADQKLEELAFGEEPGTRPSRAETRFVGVLPLTFAVAGGPALGSYLPPALRREELLARRQALVVRQRMLATRLARAAARRRALLVALRRREVAVVRHRLYTPAGGVWAQLRACESGGNYTENTGNGYYGAYQFLPSTWWSLGFTGLPNQAPPAVQDRAARMLLERQGWGAWPACSQMLGL